MAIKIIYLKKIYVKLSAELTEKGNITIYLVKLNSYDLVNDSTHAFPHSLPFI